MTNTPPIIPLYTQIKESLMTAISRGGMRPGDQLPSQRELCDQYGASHMTVRRAIEELINQGVITAIPGKGLYVANSRAEPEPETTPLVSFTEDFRRRGIQASSRVLDAYLTTASPILAKTLSVPEGTSLAYLRRLRLGNGTPMAIHTCYLVHAMCPGILDHDLNRDSLYRILKEEYHLQVSSCSATVETSLANEEVLRLLELSTPAAVFINDQITYLEDGRPIEYLHGIFRGDRFRFRLG